MLHGMVLHPACRVFITATVALLGLTACASADGSPPAAPSGSGLNSAVEQSSPAGSGADSPSTLSSPPPATASASPAPANPAPSSQAMSQPPEPTGPGGCYPLSHKNTCYEPGEYCPDADYGATGQAGDGETIVCADNDGWRWEPA
jgi:hypothetical protein